MEQWQKRKWLRISQIGKGNQTTDSRESPWTPNKIKSTLPKRTVQNLHAPYAFLKWHLNFFKT